MNNTSLLVIVKEFLEKVRTAGKGNVTTLPHMAMLPLCLLAD